MCTLAVSTEEGTLSATITAIAGFLLADLYDKLDHKHVMDTMNVAENYCLKLKT